jgi:hypothetical protein
MTGDDQYVDVELTEDQLADLELLAGRFGVSPEQYVEVAIDKIVAELDGQAPPGQVVELALNMTISRSTWLARPAARTRLHPASNRLPRAADWPGISPGKSP